MVVFDIVSAFVSGPKGNTLFVLILGWELLSSLPYTASRGGLFVLPISILMVSGTYGAFERGQGVVARRYETESLSTIP